MEAQTFAEYLKQISLSIDIVNDITFSRVKSRMKAYFATLDIKFFEFLLPTIVNGQPGLKSEWHSGTLNWAEQLTDDNDAYMGQISFSFDKKKKLCIVAEGGGLLTEANGYIDIWGGRNRSIDLPKYVDMVSDDTYASVMIPILGQNGSTIGIFNFEFGEKIAVTKKLQTELATLAEAFSTLFVLNKTNITQRINTELAVDNLNALNNFSVNFKKPRIFFAFPSSSDSQVLKSIKDVLAEYDHEVVSEPWDGDHEPGSIIDAILAKIGNSTYGLCYLSETLPENGPFPYGDNPNVLFEAGMLNSLSKITNVGPKKWFPIREHKNLTGPMPFDLQSERHVIVDRKNGVFDKEAFEENFRKKLDAMFQE